MKSGKKPTVAQRKFVESHGLNPGNWLVIQDNRCPNCGAKMDLGHSK